MRIPARPSTGQHLFIPNTFLPDLRTPVVEITKENEHLLRTRYEARSEKELPVLSRYFPADYVKGAECTWLDLILYSREQIVKENAATGKRVGELDPAPWRLISIKAQDVPFVPLCLPWNMLPSDSPVKEGWACPVAICSWIVRVLAGY